MTLRSSPLAALAALLLAAAELPAPPAGVVRIARSLLDAARPASLAVPVLFPDTHQHSPSSGWTLSMDRN